MVVAAAYTVCEIAPLSDQPENKYWVPAGVPDGAAVDGAVIVCCDPATHEKA
jgi:hypothetical protein